MMQRVLEWIGAMIARIFGGTNPGPAQVRARKLLLARTMTRFDHNPVAAGVTATDLIRAPHDLIFLNWWQFDPGTLKRIVLERRGRGKLTGFYMDRHVVRRDDSGLWGRTLGGVKLDETALRNGVFLRQYDTFGAAFITNPDHPAADEIARFLLERLRPFDPDAIFYDDLGIHWLLTAPGFAPRVEDVRRSIRALKRDRRLFNALMPNAALVVNTDWASLAVTYSAQRGERMSPDATPINKDLTGLTTACEGFIRESVYWNHGQPDTNAQRFASETRWFAQAMRVLKPQRWFSNLDDPATEAQARQIAVDLARLGPYDALGIARGVGLGLGWFVPFGID
jgi:hypothetical protein